MSRELQSLHLRWHNKTGEDMPVEISSLSIDHIRRAVELVESGATVFMPPSQYKVEREPEEVSSMVQWDRHTEF